MPTIVDSLLVTLGLDASKFKEGQAEVEKSMKSTSERATREAATIESKGAQGAEFFKSMQRAALDLGAALVGIDLVGFTLNTMKSAAAIGEMADSLGIAVDKLDAWGKAAQEFAGADPAAVEGSIGKLRLELELTKATGKPVGGAVWFQSLGIDYSKPWEQILLDTSAKLHAMGPEQAASATMRGEQMGLDPGLVRLLRQGPDAIRAHLAAVTEQGLVTPGQAKAAQDFQTALVGMEISFNTLGRTLLMFSSGALIDMLKTLGDVAELFGGKISVSEFYKRFEDRSQAAYKAAGGGQPTIYPPPAPPRSLLEEGWNWLTGGQPRIDDRSMSAEQQTFLQRLSAPESGGDYTSRNGTGHIADFSKHPGPGFGPDGTSSAAGRYQFTYETWNEAAAALGLTDFSPASQDRAAWWLANREYQQKTGRNLLADIQSGGHGGEIQTALKNRWVTITGATGAGAPAPVSASDYPSYARPGGGTGSYDSIISGALGRVRPGGTAGSLHSEVHIGSINVATAATDAHGIAGSIGDAVRRNLLVTQANRGLA